MKKFNVLWALLPGVALLFFSGVVQAQPDGLTKNVGTNPYYDPFDYTAGKLQDALDAASLVWVRESTSTVSKTKVRETTGDDIMVTSGSLSYPGLSSAGNKIVFTGTSASYYMRFNGLTTSTPHLYVSFILKVTTLPDESEAGNHFFSLGNNTNNCGMIYIRRSPVDAAKFNLGIRKSNVDPASSPVWSNQDLDINTSYYLVLGADQGSGISPAPRGDVMSLYINSTTPAVTASDGGDFANFNGIAWALFHREKGNTTNFAIEVDEFRLGLNWSQVVTATLPVTLGKFDAVAENNRSKISWTTFSEINNDHFEVQRSTDGKNFETLQRVAGKGTTGNPSDYVVYDGNPRNGINYYRLLQFDKNGDKTELGVKAVSFSLANATALSAYASESLVKVFLKSDRDEKLSFTFSSVNGKVLSREQAEAKSGQTVYSLDLKSTPATGIYVLHVRGNEGLNRSVKVFVP
ncbi:hypothetical protein FW774_00035 (plasmid) [Pedobacter sp. BS3]|uniref:hypothetical protein n=1 Tax=Pedobacter sp. BS3 TaxID=2567937 RepID=UPI0011EFEE93|nr:hypothetical protein [Pedobacter sp. BS3]TZF85507.1 hypothetical protein FW774_00035 [Pedobacter sp. BS3]